MKNKGFLVVSILISLVFAVGAFALTYTPNYRLRLPAKGESGWLNSYNYNFMTIDSGLSSVAGSIADAPEVYYYDGTFNGTTGTVITLPKAEEVSGYSVSVVPTSRAGAIGDIYVTKTSTDVTVSCSENNTTDTFLITIYYGGDINSYGSLVYREWIVSPDDSIVDHGNASVRGSLAWVNAQASGTTVNFRFPGNHIYHIRRNISIDSTANLRFDNGAIIDSSIDAITGYSWTKSGSGTNEYYLQAAGGGNPGVYSPYQVLINGAYSTEGTAGSLSTGQWDWADNDALGYSTVYVRLSDETDPDTKSPEYVQLEYSLTVAGKLAAGPHKIFDSGGLLLSKGSASQMYVEWFGVDPLAVLRAVYCSMASGVPIELIQDLDLSSSWATITASSAKVPGNLRIFSRNKALLTGDPADTFLVWDIGYSLELSGIAATGFSKFVHFNTLNAAVPLLSVEDCNFYSLAHSAFFADKNEIGDSGELSCVNIGRCVFTSVPRAIALALDIISDAHIYYNKFKTIEFVAVRLGHTTYDNQNTWSRFVVHGNTIQDIVTAENESNYGIIVYGYSASITDNKIENQTNGDDNDSESIYTKCRYSSIIGNTIIDGGRGEAFINIKGASRSVVTQPQGYSVVCMGNTLKCSSTHMNLHAVAGIALATDDVLVANNLFEGFNQSAIVSNGTPYQRHHIVGNSIYGFNATNLPSGIGCPINYTSCGVGNRIDDNTIVFSTADTAAIRIGGCGDETTMSVRRNMIRNVAGKGILVKPTVDNKLTIWVEDNMFDDVSIAVKTETKSPLFMSWKRNSHISVTTVLSAGPAATDWDIGGNTGILLQTTDNTKTTILDIPIVAGKGGMVESRLLGNQSNNSNQAAYGIASTFKQVGGTATLNASEDVFTALETDASWGGLVHAAGGSANILVRAEGKAATTINWDLVECTLKTR